MTQYIELQEKDISGILRKYNLKQIGYESIEEGAGNTTYIVRTKQDQYVLTIFEIDHFSVVNMSSLLCLLEECSFPTTRVQKLMNGDVTTSFRGKPVLLKPYIAGQVIKNLDGKMISQIGVAMANLHEIPHPDYLPKHHPYGLETFPRVIERGINLEYENWLAERYDFLVQLVSFRLPRGLIHGDMFYDNVLFNGDRFRAIIDFEEACWYYKVFDLGMGVVGLCREGLGIELPKVRSLVKGYQQIRALEDKEKEALQLFIEYAAIATSSWRFWKYNIDTPITSLSEKHWEMVKISKAARTIPKGEFMTAVFS